MFIRLTHCANLILGLALLLLNPPNTRAAQLGIFQDHGDIGTVLHPGSAKFDLSTGSYTISGSGENMWSGKDDFHFAG